MVGKILDSLEDSLRENKGIERSLESLWKDFDEKDQAEEKSRQQNQDRKTPLYDYDCLNRIYSIARENFPNVDEDTQKKLFDLYEITHISCGKDVQRGKVYGVKEKILEDMEKIFLHPKEYSLEIRRRAVNFYWLTFSSHNKKNKERIYETFRKLRGSRKDTKRYKLWEDYLSIPLVIDRMALYETRLAMIKLAKKGRTIYG